MNAPVQTYQINGHSVSSQHFYAAAAQQFERWDKATDPKTGEQAVSPHKKRRRLAERHLFEKEGFQP